MSFYGSGGVKRYLQWCDRGQKSNEIDLRNAWRRRQMATKSWFTSEFY